MVAMDPLAGLEELGFTEVPDVLASPLSSPDNSWEDGRRSAGSSSGGSTPAPPPGSSASEGCSVYVSNLAYAVSRAALARLFAPCGDVRRVSIPLDAVGRPQGHAYIEFATPHEAQAALSVAGSEVGGRPLRVSLKRSTIKGGASPSPHHRCSEPGGGRHGGAQQLQLQLPGAGVAGGRQGRAQGGGARGRPGAQQQQPQLSPSRGRVASDDASYYHHQHYNMRQAPYKSGAPYPTSLHQPQPHGTFGGYYMSDHTAAAQQQQHYSSYHHQQQHGSYGDAYQHHDYNPHVHHAQVSAVYHGRVE